METHSPMSVEMQMTMELGKRVSDSAPSAMVHAVTLKRQAKLDALLDSRERFVNNHVARFETLLDDPRDQLRRRFPTFFKSLVFVTDWRYRAVAVTVFVWMVIVTALQPEFCSVEVEDKVQSLIFRLSGFAFTFVQVLILVLIPFVYTGVMRGGGVRSDMEYKPADISNCSFGFTRLLEAQFSLLAESGEANVPREGWGATLICVYLPFGYFLLWVCILCFYTLDAFSDTNIMSTSFCLTKQQTMHYWAIHLGLIVDLLCWTLPVNGIIVALYGLHIGCRVCSMELFVWIERYRCIKDSTVEDLKASALSASTIRKDAYERYFLIHKIFSSSSRIWSAFLLVYLSLTLIGALMYLYFIIKYSWFSSSARGAGFWYMWLFWVLFLLELTLPIILIAQANVPYHFLSEMFTFAMPSPIIASGDTNGEHGLLLAPHEQQDDDDILPPRANALFGYGDYGLIGGRREWLIFLQQAPIHWVVAGVPITYEKLSAILLSAGLSIAVSAAPKIFLTLKG